MALSKWIRWPYFHGLGGSATVEYSIPTRLLDVTENALVALYFACKSLSDTDAEIIIFKCNDRDIANYPIINAIADS